ncbi:hypothetical protein SmJEL517_g01162 [Synchytrium microbalum]|uniref:Uncharacterized protein n=1 Tax=Synchytrium microbalum TaxID=1806994 RepID=A0A507CFM7_9FUNG|nr:uncharacterized protein SmJEL517_g01162 [Synchytrium microbalum]TPX36734.1 hypothetical protein SmJEL517_g01162 [Synchytrium microbalum]
MTTTPAVRLGFGIAILCIGVVLLLLWTLWWMYRSSKESIEHGRGQLPWEGYIGDAMGGRVPAIRTIRVVQTILSVVIMVVGVVLIVLDIELNQEFTTSTLRPLSTHVQLFPKWNPSVIALPFILSAFCKDIGCGGSGSLLLRAGGSIVLEYLNSRGFDSAMSVYTPECGLTVSTQVLTEREIWELLHLERPVGTMAKLKRTIADHDDSTPLLVRILDGLARLGDLLLSNREVQTDPSLVEFFDMWTHSHSSFGADLTAGNADGEYAQRIDATHPHALVL